MSLAGVKKMPGCKKQPLLERLLAPSREKLRTLQSKWLPAYLPRECLEAACWKLLEAAHKSLPKEKIKTLMAEK
jgi:hypothetical protein